MWDGIAVVSKIILAIQVPWDFVWILGWVFSVYAKLFWNFVKDCIESIDSLGSNWYPNNIESCSSWLKGHFPFIWGGSTFWTPFSSQSYFKEIKN